MKGMSYSIRAIVPVFFVALTLVGCGNSAAREQVATDEDQSSTQQTSYLIGPKQFADKMNADNVVVLDVRTPRETAQGIIEGASIINFSDPGFKTSVEGLDKSKVYLVYCASGGRSKSTQQMMNELGFKEVYDLRGGIRSWLSEGLPIVTE